VRTPLLIADFVSRAGIPWRWLRAAFTKPSGLHQSGVAIECGLISSS
jgi:hypothetical protein